MNGTVATLRPVRMKVIAGAAAVMLAATPAIDTATQVKDIRPGPESSFPNSLTNVGGTLFFQASDGRTGDELWKSDGTKVGTKLVEDIWPGSKGSWPHDLTNVGETLFFNVLSRAAGVWELWKSDGSKSGTRMVKQIDTGRSSRACGCSPWYLTNVGGMLFFSADSGTTGRELWKSDGTKRGTKLVKDINPGRRSSFPSELTSFGGTLFFTADDGRTGTELWKSDGTKRGTKLVKDINPGIEDGFRVFPSGPFTQVGGSLFFIADDGRTGTELWKSDGTKRGTNLVTELLAGREETLAYPYELTNAGGTLFFSGDDGATGLELWKSDGTARGTRLVKDISPEGSSAPARLANVGGVLFFVAHQPTTGYEVWKSDGTEAGTRLVKDVYPGPQTSRPDQLTSAGGMLFFVASEPTTGPEVWKSDGTEAGTRLVKDVYPGPTNPHGGAYPQPDFALTNVRGTLFFRADDGTSGDELWKSIR